MNVHSLATNLATKLAAVPERALEALPRLPENPWRPRRTWTAGETIAAFGLGLAAGVVIGLLFDSGRSAIDDVDPILEENATT